MSVYFSVYDVSRELAILNTSGSLGRLTVSSCYTPADYGEFHLEFSAGQLYTPWPGFNFDLVANNSDILDQLPSMTM